jgi:hypothetical protein
LICSLENCSAGPPTIPPLKALRRADRAEQALNMNAAKRKKGEVIKNGMLENLFKYIGKVISN